MKNSGTLCAGALIATSALCVARPMMPIGRHDFHPIPEGESSWVLPVREMYLCARIDTGLTKLGSGTPGMDCLTQRFIDGIPDEVERGREKAGKLFRLNCRIMEANAKCTKGGEQPYQPPDWCYTLIGCNFYPALHNPVQKEHMQRQQHRPVSPGPPLAPGSVFPHLAPPASHPAASQQGAPHQVDHDGDAINDGGLRGKLQKVSGLL